MKMIWIDHSILASVKSYKMDLRALKILTSQGEGQHLEFKKKANYPEKIVKELVAFANAEGGRLLLGVDDDGTASGVKSIDGELFLVEEAIRAFIRPQLQYTTNIVMINDKKGIAIISIERDQGKLFYVKDEKGKKYGTAYIRKSDESLQASKEMREIIERRYKKKDMQFTFDEKVKTALKFCEEHRIITIADLASEAKISLYLASRILIRLVLANVLDIEAMAGDDHYFIKS